LEDFDFLFEELIGNGNIVAAYLASHHTSCSNNFIWKLRKESINLSRHNVNELIEFKNTVANEKVFILLFAICYCFSSFAFQRATIK
jgi:hypothetical protein